jgi:glycerol-3-phosphate dehydrogenase
VKRDFAALQGQQFDLLVCGGGIYGAWTAYDAALRGLKVAVVEQGDWANAASSSSTKLIHGGLRYLETYDFKLVKKALAERQMLLEAAPHRVWPLRFGVPVFRDSRIGRLQLEAGLTLYDFLAGTADRRMRHRYLTRDEFARSFGVLDVADLKGGFSYADAQTDDARLVLELISGAVAAGAVCVNYCRLTSVLEADGKAYGAKVRDELGDAEAEIRAGQVVNTIGQWATAQASARSWCRLAKGVHLVLPSIATDQALLLTAKSDGRVFFIIPWYGRTLLGTTDTDYRGEPDRVAVEAEDIDYLLSAANYFLRTAWSRADVVGCYAGVRVLKQSQLSSPSAVSRDWELKTANNGVHYSIGGKITSAREDAARIVDAVCARLNQKVGCATRGRNFPWKPDDDFAWWLGQVGARAQQLEVDAESAEWLARRHGKRVGEVLRLIENEPELARRIEPSVPLVYADLMFCAQREMAAHLDDLLRRRMPLLILAQLSVTKLRELAEMVAPAMGWDNTAVDREVERVVAVGQPVLARNPASV